MPDPSAISSLASLFSSKPVVFLTGAGISTDSGIPDYRGKGSPPRKPMNINEYLGGVKFRARYWAGASVAANTFEAAKPNTGHLALASLERDGLISGVLTQNVDGLHLKAGSKRVVELHGNGSRIVCTKCLSRYERSWVVQEFNRLNPGYVESQKGVRVNPDGDTEVTDFEGLNVPSCPTCGGMLRPDIVYFGETVPPKVFQAAENLVDSAGALIVAGSSLAVNTGVRLVHRAQKIGLPVAVINRGPTAIDDRADLRIEAGTSETLEALLLHM